MTDIERGLLWVIRIGIFALLLVPLIGPEAMTKGFFFPFITPKNFFFRIVTEMVFGTWIALALLNSDYRPRKNPILIAFCLFIVALIAASVFGADPYHSFWSNFERMEGLVTHMHLLGLLFAMTCTFKKEREWFYFFNISLAISFLVAGHGFLQSLGLSKILGNARPYAYLGNSIYLAAYLMIHLFIVGALFSCVRNTWARVLYGFLFLFEFYVLVLSASRGVFVGFGAGACVVAIGAFFSRISLRYRVLGISVIALFVGLGLLIIFAPENPLVQKVEIFSRLSAISWDRLSDDSRIKIWSVALDAFQERPWLGWGPENFIVPYGMFYDPDLFGNEPWFDRAHNMLLEWLVAAGIVGFVAYVGIFAAVGYVLWSLYKSGRFSWMMLVLFIGFFVAYIIQNAFVFDNIVTYIYIVSIFAFLGSVFGPEGKPSKISSSLSFNIRRAGALLIIVVTIIVIFSLNTRPILASMQIITALESLGKEITPEEAVEEFKKVERHGTFGTTEARERLADTVVQISFTIENPGPGAIVLLDAAIEGIEREARLQPYVAKYPLFLGKLYILKQHWQGEGAEESLRWYEQGEKIAPHHVQMLLGKTELYLIMGNNEKAIETIERAYSLAPASASMFYSAVSTHLLANNVEGAEHVFQEYTKRLSPGMGLEGEKVDDIFRRSIRVSNLERRARFLEPFLKYAVGSVTIHQVLVQTYADMGDIEKARKHARLLVELDPSQRESVAPLLDE